jgi:hypothetical protein
MEDWRDAYRDLVLKPEGNMKDPGTDKTIIFKLIFKQWDGA